MSSNGTINWAFTEHEGRQDFQGLLNLQRLPGHSILADAMPGIGASEQKLCLIDCADACAVEPEVWTLCILGAPQDSHPKQQFAQGHKAVPDQALEQALQAQLFL